MKNVLSLSADEAKQFFLKEESYFTSKLPPYFQFNKFLEKISKRLGDKEIATFCLRRKKPEDVDDANYTLIINKDGKYAWRPLQLIHPVLYIYLVNTITEQKNWQIIKKRMFKLIKDSGGIKCSSLPIVATIYKQDKAEQIIHWSNEVEKESIINSLKYEYLFHTDITDCYGSIYTHSISWALHTKKEAKKRRWDKKLLGNIIDRQIRAMSNGQTNGIPQGSVLMDFLAEIVLCYIDSLLFIKIRNIKKSDYNIIRYRDDYRIFVNNPQIAEQIIKELTDVLNPFGMKINSGKTIKTDDVIHSSVKPDKLELIVSKREFKSLTDELYFISMFSKKFRNSGRLSILLRSFFDKIYKLSKKEVRENVKVLISIVVEISYRNPKAHPITSAILSKLIDFLPKKDKKQIVRKILNKFGKLPNTGMMQLWLQRITVKMNNNYDYSEQLCKKLTDKDTVIWNSNWLKANMRKLIDSYDLVNRDKLEEIGAVIGSEEIEVFDRYDS